MVLSSSDPLLNLSVVPVVSRLVVSVRMEGGGVWRGNIVASFFEPVGGSLVTWGCGSARGTVCVLGEVVSGPES